MSLAFSSAIANANVVTTTETPVCVITGGVSTRAGQPVALNGWFVLLAGASTTSVRIRIRRGVDATGAIVVDTGNVAIPSVAQFEFDAQAIDVPGDTAGQSYAMTVLQNAATGNGTVIVTNMYATY